MEKCTQDGYFPGTSCALRQGEDCSTHSCGTEFRRRAHSTYKEDFFDTIRRLKEGALIRHLYQDNGENKRTVGGDLYGARAWDVAVGSKTNAFHLGESRLFRRAYEDGVFNELPDRLQVVECGTGGNSGFGKVRSLLESLRYLAGHKLEAYVPVDIVGRYVKESEETVKSVFNIRSQGVVGDFMNGGNLEFPLLKDPGITPLVVMIGGTLANAQDETQKGSFSSIENAALTLRQIRDRCGKTAGTGVEFLVTYHNPCDTEDMMHVYEPTEALQAWALSGFVRAVTEGLITDPDYKPHENWKISPRYDEKRRVLLYSAEAIRDHVMPTVEGDFAFRKGDRLNHILSHKWNRNDYKEIFELAGCKIRAFYQPEGSPTGIIWAYADAHDISRTVAPARASIVAKRIT